MGAPELAAFFNQQFFRTVQFPLDGPEAAAQPQGFVVPRRHCRWGLATFEELLHFGPQSTGLEPQDQGHVEGWDQGGIHCYLIHSAQ